MRKIIISSHQVFIGEIYITILCSTIMLGLDTLGDILCVHKTSKVELISPKYNLFKHYLKLLANPFDYRDLSYISNKYWCANASITTHFYLNPRRFIGLFLEEIIDELRSKVAKYNAQR